MSAVDDNEHGKVIRLDQEGDRALPGRPDSLLGLYFQEILLSLQRYVSRHGHRMLQANGTLNDLYVSFREASAVLAGTSDGSVSETLAEHVGWASQSDLERALIVCREEIAAREADADRNNPIKVLRDHFHLTPNQLRLLMAAAAPAVSVDIGRLFTFAWADFSQKCPTAGFLSELLADSPEDVTGLLNELRSGEALLSHCLVLVTDSPGWGAPTPLLHQSVRVPERLIGFLLGHTEPLASALANTCELSRPIDMVPRDRLVVDPSCYERLQVTVQSALRSGTGRPRPLMIGSLGTGRRTALQTVLADEDWGLLTVDLGRVTGEGEQAEQLLREVCREALLRRCFLLLRAEALVATRESVEKWARTLSRVLEAYPGPLALTVSRAEARLHGFISGLFELPFPLPSSADQRGLWERVIAESGCVIRDDAPAILTERFNITPGTIHRTIAEAYSRAAMLSGNPESVALKIADLSFAIRRKTDHALGAIAEPFSTTLTWDDVVLNDKVMEVLTEIQSYARHRELVYDHWGFRKKISYGRGLSCLFAGPPGTGKTMMSAVLAESLGRELYRVDLSRVVSKWVGETEKNLALAFDEAERGQLVLLFDEADALFSKRTKGKSSNDRFANMEINYLLQRMESFDGMSILTTNKEKAIDEAFKRRIKFKVSFPMPEANLRAQLWQRMLPPEASVESNIDFAWLGEQFEMSGGNIRNATLRAAFYAAEADGIITHEFLYKAAVAEAREMGMVVRDEM